MFREMAEGQELPTGVLASAIPPGVSYEEGVQERLRLDNEMLSDLVDYWSDRAQRAENALKLLVPPMFAEGSLVSFKGRPAWGVGLVEVSVTGSETCGVRWLSSDPERETLLDCRCSDLELEEGQSNPAQLFLFETN